MACGEYIAFLDSDDVFLPQALEILVFFARQNNSDVVCANYTPVYNGNFIFPKEQNCEISSIQSKNYHCPYTAFLGLRGQQAPAASCRRLWRASAVKNIRFNDVLSYDENMVFIVDSFDYCKKITNISADTALVRIHEDSVSFRVLSERALGSALDAIIILYQSKEKTPKYFMDMMMGFLVKKFFNTHLIPMLDKRVAMNPKLATKILKHWNTDVIDTRVLSFWKRWKLWATLKMIAAHE